MKRMVDGILQAYGTTMVLTHGQEKVSLKGFFQPVRSKSWQSMVDLETPLGEVFRGQYIYIGPAQVALSEGDILEVGQRSYFVRRAEKYYFGDEVAYTWGMCVEKGVNDTWGSRS